MYGVLHHLKSYPAEGAYVEIPHQPGVFEEILKCLESTR